VHFVVHDFRFSSGCPIAGSPCWCRLWIVVKAICAMKYYGILPLDLELYVWNGTYFTIYFHSSLLSSPSIILHSVNWRPPSLWLLPIKRLQG